MSFRIEKKFKLTNSDKRVLKASLIENGMEKLYKGRLVNSCYLDTYDLRMFSESDEGILPRKKIRFRWYENEEVFNKEIKISSVEGRFKRFKKIENFNLRKLKLCKLFDNNYGAIYPSLIVKYYREYYLYKDLRFTFDSNIQYYDPRSISFRKYFDYENVMEIKTSISVPEDYLEKIIGIQPARFSKYCRGLSLFI
tara:strand:- start:1188 stop:1775 length:588 start_codon:yes stop_codon:yes gene_type:complete